MPLDPRNPPQEVHRFLAERHLATLTTTRADGSPHVTPVGVTYDAAHGVARIITWAASRKARNVAARPGQRVAVAVARYAERYRQPKQRADRVAIEITVDRLLGRP